MVHGRRQVYRTWAEKRSPSMGIAVVVLSVAGELDTKTAVIMLGIGAACAGVSLLENKQRDRNLLN